MSVCPKHAWGGVKGMLHSVFDRLDADAVHAEYDKPLCCVVRSRAMPRRDQGLCNKHARPLTCGEIGAALGLPSRLRLAQRLPRSWTST
jgi:hypothetical protein